MPLSRGKRSSSSNALNQTPSPTSVAVQESEPARLGFQVSSLGVYTLAEERVSLERGEPLEEKLRGVCLHNAQVCTEYRQTEKGNVWDLLAQMAENTLEDEHDNFNGWGGAYGGALGHNLISSFLDYYEAKGDVQMLATMVCVLSGGQRQKVSTGFSLLPASHEDRYDMYIRQYADLLYGWRLMSTRAELNKHLVQRLPETDDQFTAIDVAFWCNQCQREVAAGNAVCKQCGNYTFRCSICDIAVRGLFTVCALCGHGGHMDHMKTWFADHSVCPTGCGCECVLNTSLQEVDAVSNMPTIDKSAGPFPYGGFN